MARSARLSRFLSYVVEETLAGRAENLKEYPLGVEVFGKSASFDPRLDSAVRVDARRLRAKLDEYYATDGKANPLRIAMQKGSYVPEFLPNIPETVAVKTATPPAVPARSRSALWTGVAVLSIAVLIAGGWWVARSSRSQPQHVIHTIAVLPFSNLSGTPDLDVLADALTEELTDRFARLEGVRVVSRTSAFQYKGKHRDVREIAKDLSSDSVLTGSVRRGEGYLRVTVQLVRGGDGSNIWSESFDIDPGDELRTQTQIGQRIERRMAANLPNGGARNAALTEEERRVENMVVHAGMLVQRQTPEALERALSYAEQAVKMRPDYGPAHAVLADVYLSSAGFGPEAPAWVDKSRASAKRAIKLAPDAASAYATLGAIRMDYEWAWSDAEDLFRRAVSLNPSNLWVRVRYARFLVLQGRYAEALEHAKQAELQGPQSVMAAATLGQVLYYSRRYSEAVNAFRRAIEIDPGYWSSRNTLTRSLYLSGATAEAKAEAASLSTSPEAAALRCWLAARENDKAEAAKWLSESKGASVISRAGAYAATGDLNEAFRLIETSVKNRDPHVVYMKVSPALDPLRSNARLESFCREVGLSGCTSHPGQ
jgi:TolB-like protein/Tfp pilus assembly protein PilF